MAGAALIVLGRAGLRATRVGANVLRRVTWGLAAVSVIAALMNFASHSRWENLIFGPTALLLAILCTIVARSQLEPHRR
jgi:preprotein translocase subunit SecY